MFQDILVGEDFDQQFEFILLLEVLIRALANFFSVGYFFLEVIDHFYEKLLDVIGFIYNLGV